MNLKRLWLIPLFCLPVFASTALAKPHKAATPPKPAVTPVPPPANNIQMVFNITRGFEHDFAEGEMKKRARILVLLVPTEAVTGQERPFPVYMPIPIPCQGQIKFKADASAAEFEFHCTGPRVLKGTIQRNPATGKWRGAGTDNAKDNFEIDQVAAPTPTPSAPDATSAPAGEAPK